MNWISVKKKRPRKDAQVLVWDTEHEAIFICDYDSKIYEGNPKEFREAFSGHHLPLVTHWMKLPAPPESVQEVSPACLSPLKVVESK